MSGRGEPAGPARPQGTGPARAAPARPRDDGRARRYAWRVLSVTSLGSLLAAANTSTLDVGLPSVARHFHATATEAAWALLGYMMVNTVMILVFGRLADMIGRRRLYQFGLGTLTTASLLCGLAPNAVALDLLRAVQGVGSAAVITNTAALLTDAFPAELLSVGLGLSATVVAGAQVLGPLVGGGMATLFGWRAVFWFNVPTGAVGLVWARFTLRRQPPPPARREPFDMTGAVLWTVLLGGIVLALTEGGALGWTSTPVVIGLVAFGCGAPLFALVELRRSHPMLDLGLFADRERSMAFLAGFLQSVARFAVVLLMGLYVQAAGGLDPFEAGVRVFLVALGMAVAAPLTGLLARRHGPRLLSTSGMGLTAAGLLALAVVVRPHASAAQVAACLFTVGIGTGTFMTPNTNSIMSGVRPNQRGIANGIRSTLQNTGYVTSTALSLAIVTSGLSAADKRAAYAGTLVSLSPRSLVRFTADYRVALVVLAAASVAGMVASALRSTGAGPPLGPVAAGHASPAVEPGARPAAAEPLAADRAPAQRAPPPREGP